MMKRLFVGTLFVCIVFGGSPAGAATLTTHASEADAIAALDPSAVIVTESFDGFADGTPITTQLPGTVFSSPNSGQPGYVEVQAFATNRAESPPNILSGGYIDNSRVAQTIVMDFSPPASGLFFTLIAQNPNRIDRTLTFEFADGSPAQTTPIVDTDGNNNNREFFAVTSDVAFSRVTLTMAPKPGGQFNEFGGVDDFGYAFLDDRPPICADEPAFRGPVQGTEGTATDLGTGQTRIVDVSLDPGATNLTLTVDPFAPPASTVTYFLSQTDSTLDATGTARVTDGAGNTCVTEVTFRVLPSGAVVNETLCSGEGNSLTVSNDNPANPAGLAYCSGSTAEFEPAFPSGYEQLAGCRVVTVASGISGPTDSLFDLHGPFQPEARVLFSRSDDGINFTDFRDVTEAVFHVNPTRMRTTTITWSDVKYTCAIQAEICDGIDNDSDGLVDEGYELELVECTGAGPFDPAVCDVDGDGFFVCGDPVALESINPVNGDCADQLAFINLAAPEQCNGLDDDCDGTPDDGNPEGDQPCPVPGEQGICAVGATACESARLVCNQTVFPGDEQEVCDGLDNDCDGTVDDGDPGGGQACSVPGQTGVCEAGLTACSGGSIVCSQTVFPTDEICDGLDNDCDGLVDEDNPGGGQACAVPDQAGACAAGVTTCSAGSLVCTQTVFPTPEICDGVDNDCNGQTDENIVFGGFQPPVNPDGSTIFLHRTDPRSRGTKAIPFRFELLACDQTPITNDVPTIAVISQSPGVAGTQLAEEDISCGKGDEGGVVPFNNATQRYEYNFCTKELEPDMTIIFGVTTGDGAVYPVQVSID